MRLTAIILVAWCGLGAGVAHAEDRQITVIGEGVITQAPDQAVISVGVSHQTSSAQMAMEMVNDAARAMIVALDDAGIEARDMQTSGLSLRAVHDRNRNGDERPLLLGFSASNRLTVKVRDLEAVGGVLGTLVKAGANDIGGITFGLRDPKRAQDDARRNAVADAQTKAALYADAAGVSLGKVVSISESGSAMPRPEMMRASMASFDAVPVAPGELSVTAHVTMVWELAD
ncbi:26 kDa periplasmic immunogenic protein precursor [Shimia sp. SK013]|uniref:SIMPL domain-containing protein n=1 Tax=Shimia sp. SK013 TaxID=1389006 RepID=UPI0006CC6D64|nr:SIMPL domain-containing protein [Shimia sp. SK013]KPA22019.1 26 kDa periplasmic immunogenic protein precursor [Shimia sp. SK013]